MLKTVDEIVDSLGGSGLMAKALGVEISAVSMWKSRRGIPPTRFIAVSELLARIGKQADPAVFGFVSPKRIPAKK